MLIAIGVTHPEGKSSFKILNNIVLVCQTYIVPLEPCLADNIGTIFEPVWVKQNTYAATSSNFRC